MLSFLQHLDLPLDGGETVASHSRARETLAGDLLEGLWRSRKLPISFAALDGASEK